MKFLQTADTMEAVRDMIREGPVTAVVAYWGDGAVEAMGIEQGQKLTIICDVLSGGCRPAEIKTLQKLLGRERVLTHNKLHAKVWLSETAAIVGSSNASSNGMGFEGNAAKSLIEANLFVDDENVLADVKKWAKRICYDADKITIEHLKKAEKLYKKYRGTRPLPEAASLLDGLRADPEAYADMGLEVWVYDHLPVPQWTGPALEEARLQRENNEIDFYIDVERPPGTVIIDFDSTQNPPRFGGIWRVVDPPIFRAPEGLLLLCQKVTDFHGQQLGSRPEWRAAAARAADSEEGENDGEWSADDFARQFIIGQ